MISSKSIRYFTREGVIDGSQSLTVSDLHSFLGRLITGGHGGSKILIPSRNEWGINNEATCYTLDSRKGIVLLD